MTTKSRRFLLAALAAGGVLMLAGQSEARADHRSRYYSYSSRPVYYSSCAPVRYTSCAPVVYDRCYTSYAPRYVSRTYYSAPVRHYSSSYRSVRSYPSRGFGISISYGSSRGHSSHYRSHRR